MAQSAAELAGLGAEYDRVRRRAASRVQGLLWCRGCWLAALLSPCAVVACASVVMGQSQHASALPPSCTACARPPCAPLPTQVLGAGSIATGGHAGGAAAASPEPQTLDAYVRAATVRWRGRTSACLCLVQWPGAAYPPGAGATATPPTPLRACTHSPVHPCCLWPHLHGTPRVPPTRARRRPSRAACPVTRCCWGCRTCTARRAVPAPAQQPRTRRWRPQPRAASRRATGGRRAWGARLLLAVHPGAGVAVQQGPAVWAAAAPWSRASSGSRRTSFAGAWVC